MVHIILWHYSDGSGRGAVAAFNNEEDAKLLIRDLAEHGDLSKSYEIVTLEIR